jgi:hypothetical protein
MNTVRELIELDERSRTALAIYENSLKAAIEAKHMGKGIAIDPETGDYEIGNTPFSAARRLRERHPKKIVIQFRIGLVPNPARALRLQAETIPPTKKVD